VIVIVTVKRCYTDHAKSSFYYAANAIFATVGRFASEEVILELIFYFKKCLPVLTYGFKVCALLKSIIYLLRQEVSTGEHKHTKHVKSYTTIKLQ